MSKYKFQIEQLKKVLEKIGSPHNKIPVISIAGTNGKGSVSVIIQSILTNRGLKTGLYTSPHIFKFTERISIDNHLISLSRFKSILREIRLAERNGECELTKFELITAIAIKYFYEEGCDFCIMETGLGGRLDATNVCENKKVCVITPISTDHADYLGNTINEIAREKAGIIKPEIIVIDGSGIEIVRKIALEKRCKIYTLGLDYTVENIRLLTDGNYRFHYKTPGFEIENVVPGLKGIHQCYNAAAAITAVIALGYDDSRYIKNGIKKAYLPARLEIFDLPDGKKIIVDTAHNPAAIKVVANFISSWIPEKSKLYVIIGIYMDKDYKKMAKILFPMAEKVWAITPNSKRALSGDRLARLFKSKGKASKSFDDAFEEAVIKMKSGDWLVGCGSFSVAKPALELIHLLQ